MVSQIIKICSLWMLIAFSGQLYAGGSMGGSTPNKVLDIMQKAPNSRIYVLDDRAFIDVIGMLSNKENVLVTKANLNLDSVIINKGYSYISAFRNGDGNEIYFVSQSQFDELKPNTNTASLVKELQLNADLVKLTP